MGETRKTRILVADDHPVVRIGVRNILESQPEFEVVGEAADGREALEAIHRLEPDMLLLDLAMPNLPGIETLRELTAESMDLKTILLTATIDNRQIVEALQLGAKGVVLKDVVVSDLIECVTTVAGGGYWLGGEAVTNLAKALQELMASSPGPVAKTFGLTPRERQVVTLVAQGCSNREIAKECKISEETVKAHLKNIFDKLGVFSRLELALYAINHHLVEETPAT